ncbi:hypothetical protein BDV41DRAFT_543298 [Aspergillus transmontanensis]|uniref:Uncharacterized protein n=1 Tax=Aspergillus transmontanensis TaxID=1034304 RepID=A0A5N6VR42_9EURO|nr:hypothetical protein BDV41DRAFT_543298 [Aspergillus transmontanensis]
MSQFDRSPSFTGSPAAEVQAGDSKPGALSQMYTALGAISLSIISIFLALLGGGHFPIP